MTAGGNAGRWPVLAATGGTLAAVAVRAALPTGVEYTRGFAPAWVTTVALLLAAAAVAGRGRLPVRVLRPAGWAAVVLLVWSAGGLVFDLLRLAALLGVPGLPPVVDWPGLVVRAGAVAVAGTLAAALLAFRRTDRPGCPSCGRSRARSLRWAGYTAAALAVPYPALKAYWWAGGTVARAAVGTGSTEGFPIGELVLFGLAALLAVLLVHPLGARLPSIVPTVAGWAAAATLVSMGALAGFGALAQASGLADGPVRVTAGGWIVWLVYGSWLLLGLALGAATVQHRRRSRPYCPGCGT